MLYLCYTINQKKSKFSLSLPSRSFSLDNKCTLKGSGYGWNLFYTNALMFSNYLLIFVVPNLNQKHESSVRV